MFPSNLQVKTLHWGNRLKWEQSIVIWSGLLYYKGILAFTATAVSLDMNKISKSAVPEIQPTDKMKITARPIDYDNVALV